MPEQYERESEEILAKSSKASNKSSITFLHCSLLKLLKCIYLIASVRAIVHSLKIISTLYQDLKLSS